MLSSRSHLLSIALTPTTAQITEAKRTGAGVKVLRQSTLILSENTGLDQPAALGTALAEHLKQQGYGTKHVVLGLCPRWVLARSLQVPPADTEAMRGIVNLQVERAFAGSASDLRFDYLLGSEQSDEDQVSLLLAGVRLSLLHQAQAAAEAAGLHVLAITPTTLAGVGETEGVVVLVEPGMAGVISVQPGDAVAGLVSCPVETDCLDQAQTQTKFLANLSRCILQLPGQTAGKPITLILPPTVSKTNAQAIHDAAAKRFDTVTLRQHNPAELLAKHLLTPDREQIDFTNSRLAPPKRQPMPPAMQWAIRAAVLVLLIGGAYGYLWFSATAQRDTIKDQYAAIKDRADHLNQTLEQTRDVEAWFDERPPTLDALLELTQTFPTEGAIRVKTLTLEADMTGQIECTAENRQTMDRYFDSMQASSTLLNPDKGTVRPTGGRSTWIDFPIGFTFDLNAQQEQTP